MSRVNIKNLPQLRLADLLRRRKMTLNSFIEESGVQTYEALALKCERLGCVPPLREEWQALRPAIVSSPSDGVIVMDPVPALVEEEEVPETDLTEKAGDEPEAERPKPRRRRGKQQPRDPQDGE